MDRPFYTWLPDWAQNMIRDRTCSKCSAKYSKNDIIAVGIRELENSTVCAFYVEHKCATCSFRGITTLNNEKKHVDLEVLCYKILEGVKNRKLTEMYKNTEHKVSSEPMTESEVNAFINFVQHSESHEEFLKEIGGL